MASAFQAGMIGGFADTFVQKIQDRTDKAEKYEDMMIASAKANAPKYAETTAAYKATVSQARQLKDSFGFTDSEIVAMASKYDLNAIHKTLMEQKMAAEANASELGFDKSTILGSLNMASSVTMPKGMTLESGLRNILFNTTQNLNASNNPKSEVNKRGAFGKAMADFLALNPRASAEEQLKSMQYAGFSMDELRNFNASAGRGDIFPEVTAGPLALPDQDYKSSDFGSTQNKTRQTFARNFKVLNADGTDIDASLAKNLQTPNGVIDVFKDIETASEYMAFLESNIAFKGYGAGFGNELKRTGALSRLIRSIDTPEELKAFVAAERDGRFTKLIIETDGTFTDTQLEAVLNGEPIPGVEPEEETSVDAAGTDPLTETSTAAAADAKPAPLSTDDAINAKVAELVASSADTDEDLSISDTSVTTEEPTSDSDDAIIAEALARSDAIDDKLEAQRSAEEATLKRIQDNDRQFIADEKNFPQAGRTITPPSEPEEAPLIDMKLVNTGDDLRAAIEARTGVMPTDYIAEAGPAVRRMNEALKEFEKSVNVKVDNAIETVTPSNIGEAIHNLIVRMFDTVVGDETLEERIMKNEGQQHRAAAFAKLQEQLGELTLFPKRVSVDMKDIDPYPTMDAMASERLHSLQDDINESILSTTKKFLSSIGIGSKKEEDSSKPKPLMAKPKRAEKPKEMTSSDRARLKRAQKARELGKDTGLLETLVEKYGIALVQKEMGL